ncbi:tyrosine protein phosphatase [Pontibacillus halophilus JSM 076056 = DSM 19796]|uniref:Tyrosine-protein phosphatase n=1 Tax=Pontibacillus halophilus JSM 076056 = DSM 19796 TaxID=1385510 RepID=A0A0A5GRN7_9BACI|nr:CpsB/CapC family capsule biosynthesis tyrosine phosphatase [Pontibacillus halophilus]KGX93908.1 tyrosine protein phosphatase [Pontibacillus halophilus JSM 076056 = DSM 19796]
MIEISCHILDENKDVQENMDASLKVAREAVKAGITSVIATPNYEGLHIDNYKERIHEQVSLLNEMLDVAGIPLSVLPGEEVNVNAEIVNKLHLGRLITMNSTNYVFIAIPKNSVPLHMHDMLFDLQINGYIPVITQPERNKEIQSNPNKLYDLVKNGAKTVVSTHSLLGHRGRKGQKLVEKLIEADLIHLLTCDVSLSNKSKFNLKEASEYLAKKFGDQTKNMFTDNARKLVAGEHFGLNQPKRIVKKTPFAFLR